MRRNEISPNKKLKRKDVLLSPIQNGPVKNNFSLTSPTNLGSEEMKQKYLPDVATGEKFAAFGLTEANAGSDASGIQTTAVQDGDEWVLNGTKQWITNGGEAQIYTVVAMTDRSRGARGASMFVVEEGDPGFSCGPKEMKMGIRTSSTTELIFKDFPL